ncbi:YvcK family protein [Actinospica durhamensis]|uniref:YvcK family protein n=1 Tax=Actinospica durhamensis TaxID=1508375 RepID=A0A941IS98_9ACTN|nr:uridine diphosphate-N-acetylglucosamine-binding protein YvcK [Actinospica durhamensis]MBR7833021.1 YvcK family protein [Actinospica durhamensis]
MPHERSGPRVVAIGGGRGLAASVAAVRAYAGHVTAVVTTADDSGSSGRLRVSRGIPAPGDLRRALVALAGAQGDPLGRAFEHRFEGTDLAGHTLGNLVIAALTAESGDFVKALDLTARLLGADPELGRALPATLEPVVLRARTRAGAEVLGQYAISQTPGIATIAVDPPRARAAPGVVEAVLAADQVVLGPGSVYTSILAAVLIEEIRQALAETKAQCVYVCNLEPEQSETEGYDTAAHVEALWAHGVCPEVVVVNAGGDVDGSGWALDASVRAPRPDDPQPDPRARTRVVAASLAAPDGTAHDPALLGAVLAELARDR